MSKSHRPVIPWARPVFWGNEKRYVTDALESTWISGGAYIERLEHEVLPDSRPEARLDLL